MFTMEVMWTILCIIFTLTVIWIYAQRGRYRLPPGPRGLPLLGSFLDISTSSLHAYSTGLSKVYGGIISVNILGETCVVLNSHNVIREALSSEKFADVFSGRPKTFLQYTKGGRNATSCISPSPEWGKQRKMLHKTLKMYGDGVKEMEITVQQELNNVVEWITAQNMKKFKFSEILYFSLLNIISILLVGKRFEYDSKEIQMIVNVLLTTSRLGAPWKEKLLNLFPFLLRVPVGIGRDYALYYEAEKHYDKEFFYKQKASYDPVIMRGLVDVMLRTQEESRDASGTTWLTDDKIASINSEMIAAGVMTTHGALMSIFLMMIHKPEVRDKVADEVDRVIGGNRAPRLSDRPEMPYTEAAILEVLRLISHLPFALPHCTTRDVEFRDFLIPANTTVFVNYWAAHHDESVWESPWEFKPERFLDDDGKLVSVDHINRRNMMAFSVGKRSCLGEVFAKSRLFLFVTTLLQHFAFEAAGDETLPSCDPRDSIGTIILEPKEYWVIAKPRD